MPKRASGRAPPDNLPHFPLAGTLGNGVLPSSPALERRSRACPGSAAVATDNLEAGCAAFSLDNAGFSEVGPDFFRQTTSKRVIEHREEGRPAWSYELPR